jgi:hypothetical protein
VQKHSAVSEAKSKRFYSCKSASVDAAASFDFRVRYREVILFEREAGTPNWNFNREIIGFGRVHMAENVPYIFLYFLH